MEVYRIKNIEKINIQTPNGKTSFGPNQEWYLDERARIAGCGPTSGALITAYLAASNPERYGALYQQPTFAYDDFVRHMQQMYRYLRPGAMGLNRLESYREGMEKYAADTKTTLKPLTFPVAGIEYLSRDRETSLCAFVRDALCADQPIAFLALSRGRERALQNWHWITIVSAKIGDQELIATASDEGISREFDLLNWYRTTRLSGGLLRFSS